MVVEVVTVVRAVGTYLDVVVVVLAEMNFGLIASLNAAIIAPRGECQLSSRQYALCTTFPLPAIVLSNTRAIPATRVLPESSVKMTYPTRHALLRRGRCCIVVNTTKAGEKKARKEYKFR